VGDEDGGYRYEAEEMLRLAFVAAMQSSAAGQPGHGSLDHPAVSAKSFGGLDTFAGDALADATLSKPPA
jgi:hypothetical protein